MAFSFENYFRKDFQLLQFLGIWIINDKSKYKKLFAVYFFIINILCNLIFNAAQVMNLIFESTSLTKFAACGYVIAISCMSNVRSYYIFKNRKNFRELIVSLSDPVFIPVGKDEEIIAMESLNIYKKVETALLWMSSVTVAVAMFIPIFYDKNEGLPFASWYPFDVSLSPVHQIVYVHQCISVFYVAYTNIFVDIIMAAFVSFIGIQCDLICHRLDSMDNDFGIRGSLKEYIEYHKKILGFSKTMEEVFSRIYFGQFAACTAALCMTLFLITLVPRDTFEFFYLVVYQSSIFSLLLIPCWFSSEMRRKSENIPAAIYGCPWVKASQPFKKEVIFFIHRTQEPITFYAVGFFQITVETFMWIVRSSFSYYTVLNSMNLNNA